MRKLNIATGNNRQAFTWQNKIISFDELCERLKTTIRTDETTDEYPHLAKLDKEAAKDKGGFVGGLLKNNRRTKETVVSRSMITLDSDSAEVGFIDKFNAECKYVACLYTTHGHRPDSPRVRIIIPLTRDVTPDEYVALSRFFADEWGIDQFGTVSYVTNQLMYWPTTPIDGEYLFRRIDGQWLDPDTYLANYPSWEDITTLPTSIKEKKLRENSRAKQQNPLSKDGLVGAFCRTYSIVDAIDTFLKDVYEPSAVEGRYDYIPASSNAGVIVYDDIFAYSHHATDPASGMLLNAFDLVRIHKFGNADEKRSFQEMCDFAANDDNVKLNIINEKIGMAKVEFGDDWIKGLTYMKRSTVLENTTANLLLILENDPDFSGFAFNDLADQVEIIGEVPWVRPEGNKYWKDVDTAQLKALIDKKYLSFSSRNHEVAFTKVVHDRHFHPIRDYLDSLPEWDRVQRVDKLFIDFFQATDSDYIRSVTRKTFVAAVARIYKPGIKFDIIPVIDGEQGIGKSSIIKYLAGEEYFSDGLQLTDMDDKTAAEKLQGFWIVEIAELAGMKKADIEKVKSFVSTSNDKYRPSYGRVVESHPRQCIIIATVNGKHGYLRDITGNRRFWVIKLEQKEQKWSWTEDENYRDQFWAEAKYRYEHGEKLYLEGEDLKESEKAQIGAMESDDRQGMLEDYLNTLLPDNWDEMDLYSRRSYLEMDELSPKGIHQRTTVSNMEIWCECFMRNKSDIKSHDSYSIAALMLQVPGWERSTQSRRIPIYGLQRLYKRIETIK